MSNRFFDARVALLVGHWQKDSGALDPVDLEEGDCLDTVEANLTLRMSKAIRAELLPLVSQVKLIGGSFPSRMAQISEMMAHVALSVHANSATQRGARGHEVLVNPQKHAENMALAEIADRCLDRYLVNTDRGIKIRTDLYELNRSPVPTILVEPGFITNPEDERYLWSSDTQTALAKALVLTLGIFFGRT